MPFVAKKKAYAIIDEWLSDFEGHLTGKLQPIQGKPSREWLRSDLFYLMSQITDFWRLGIFHFGDFFNYIELLYDITENDDELYDLVEYLRFKALGLPQPEWEDAPEPVLC